MYRTFTFAGLALGILAAGCSQNYNDQPAPRALDHKDLQAVMSTLNAQKQTSATVTPVPTGGLAGIDLNVPEGWRQVPPSSSMRVAEFRLAGARPNDKEATLAVFAGRMGTVEANINRWIGQFSQPDGSASGSQARRWHKTVDGMPVALVDVPGTYAPNMGMSQGPPPTPEPGFRMLGAIVDYGPKFYYFKLVGPRDTVSIWATSFETFINNIKRT